MTKSRYSTKGPNTTLLIVIAVLGWLVAGVVLLLGTGNIFLAGAAGRSSCNLDYPITCEGGDLTDQDLSGLDFTYAHLRSTDMSGVDVNGKDFYLADLTDTNLSGADLTGASFLSASLTSADLSGADLTGASFVDDIAVLQVQLDGVTWSDTTCPDGTNSDDHHMTCLNNMGGD